MSEPTITWTDFEKHIFYYDCWVLIEGIIYDVTDFLVEHPGGDDILMQYYTVYPGIVAKTQPNHLDLRIILNMQSVSETPGELGELSHLSTLKGIWRELRVRKGKLRGCRKKRSP